VGDILGGDYLGGGSRGLHVLGNNVAHAPRAQAVRKGKRKIATKSLNSKNRSNSLVGFPSRSIFYPEALTLFNI
jgi:hypothetical protein